MLFEKDDTVVPKESSWFGSYAPQDSSSGEFAKVSIPLRLQPLYLNDTIGLKTLDERGGLALESCPGRHMEISNCWRPLVEKYIGGSIDNVSEEIHAVSGQDVIQIPIH